MGTLAGVVVVVLLLCPLYLRLLLDGVNVVSWLRHKWLPLPVARLTRLAAVRVLV